VSPGEVPDTASPRFRSPLLSSRVARRIRGDGGFADRHRAEAAALPTAGAKPELGDGDNQVRAGAGDGDQRSTRVSESSSVPTGAQAPDFTLPRSGGGEVSLSSFRGRPVVLVFLRGYT
jgi:AhpC/TSA family